MPSEGLPFQGKLKSFILFVALLRKLKGTYPLWSRGCVAMLKIIHGRGGASGQSKTKSFLVISPY